MTTVWTRKRLKLTTKTWGGKREGAGSKSIADTIAKPRNVSLDDWTVETLKEYGDDNLSEGIRRAAKLVALPDGTDPPRRA